MRPSGASNDLSLRPFVGVTLAGLVLVTVPWDGTDWIEFGIAGALFCVVAALVLWAHRRRFGELGGMVPALIYIAAVGFLRDAVGGAMGGVGILALLPVIWTALHGTRRQLGLVIGTLAVVWALPLVVIGAPAYPAQGWRGVLLLLSVCAVLGYVVQRLVMQVRADAAERGDLVERLAQLAGTDQLTGLPNRRTWNSSLADALADAGDASVSVAIIDLDGLKAVNDETGHAAGDILLRTASAHWQRELGPDDLLARLGGDEFAVLLPGRPLVAAVELIERLREVMPASETCSAGVAEAGPSEHPSTLLGRADAALYAAKRAGGDRTFTGPTPVRAPAHTA